MPAQACAQQCAKGSLKERATVIADTLELARQTALGSLRGLYVESADEFIGDAVLRAVREHNSAAEHTGHYQYSTTDPAGSPRWRKVSLGGRNYLEALPAKGRGKGKSKGKSKGAERSYLYDLCGAQSPSDLYGAVVLCRDQRRAAHSAGLARQARACLRWDG